MSLSHAADAAPARRPPRLGRPTSVTVAGLYRQLEHAVARHRDLTPAGDVDERSPEFRNWERFAAAAFRLSKRVVSAPATELRDLELKIAAYGYQLGCFPTDPGDISTWQPNPRLDDNEEIRLIVSLRADLRRLRAGGARA